MTKDLPKPQPGILDIAPYVPGKSGCPGDGPVIKLSSNETPLGASPKAIAAYKQAAEDLQLYPDGSSLELRQAISERFGLNADHIICGAGSDELLNLLANAYLGPGDEAIYTTHGFLVYPIAIMANGATPVVAPEKDYRTDVDAILALVGPKTKMVFIANPNNPTGTYIPFDEVRRLQSALPGHVVLVLDGAYAEYVSANDYEAGIELVATNSNVVMTRTFSKIYGLASLRIGWAYCSPEIADVLNRIRGPFNLCSPAIKAGAAAMNDQQFVAEAQAHTKVWREWVSRECETLGLQVTPSVGNFVLIHFPDIPGLGAHEADDYLVSQRIILRRVDNYHLPNALRMTIGSADDCRATIKALSQFMQQDTKGSTPQDG
jgi:histidinol-phosphate aminotransferase